MVVSMKRRLNLDPIYSGLKIRPYLGEQLAFYFKFVAHLAQSMILPGIVGIVFAIYNSVVGSQTIGYQRSVLCTLFSCAGFRVGVLELRVAGYGCFGE